MRAEATDDADLAYWLSRWASWMRWNMGELPSGAPSTAAGFQCSASNYAVSETDSNDYWDGCVVPAVVAAVDSAIDSLAPQYRVAVWVKFGLRKKPAPIPENVAELYSEAFDQLRALVLRRVAIAA